MGGEVHVIYLQFTDRHQREGLAELRRQVGRWFPGREAHFLVVDNAFRGDHEARTREGVEWMAGDNSTREFSGYELGLHRLETRFRLEPNSPLVFANDTFHRSYGTAYLRAFTPAAIGEGLRRGAVVGHIDAYPRAVMLEGLRFREWIRTSLFVTTYATIRHLLPLALSIPDEAIFSTDYRLFFRPDAPLSENYREYLSTWLYGTAPAGSEFQERWHSKVALDAATFEPLKQKARCILSEHSLSARAQRMGILLYDPAREHPGLARSVRRAAGRLLSSAKQVVGAAASNPA